MQCRLLTPDEFRKADDDRMALGKRRGADPDWLKANKSDYGWARLVEITGPCVMWFATWYFDPNDPEHASRRIAALEGIAKGHPTHGYLSRFYWQDWSDKRSPICVLCPNGAEWCVDAKSSNGEGWHVIGDPPLLRVTPSIDAPGYHGWLGSSGAAPGEFKLA